MLKKWLGFACGYLLFLSVSFLPIWHYQREWGVKDLVGFRLFLKSFNQLILALAGVVENPFFLVYNLVLCPTAIFIAFSPFLAVKTPKGQNILIGVLAIHLATILSGYHLVSGMFGILYGHWVWVASLALMLAGTLSARFRVLK